MIWSLDLTNGTLVGSRDNLDFGVFAQVKRLASLTLAHPLQERIGES